MVFGGSRLIVLANGDREVFDAQAPDLGSGVTVEVLQTDSNDTGGNATGTVTVSWPSQPTEGSILAVVIQNANQFVEVTSDDGFTPFAADLNLLDNSYNVSMWRKIAGPSEPQFPTWTLDVGQNFAYCAMELAADSPSVDEEGGTTGNGSTATTPTVSVASPSVIVAGFSTESRGLSNYTAGYSLAVGQDDGTGLQVALVWGEEESGSVSVSADLGASGDWAAGIAEFIK